MQKTLIAFLIILFGACQSKKEAALRATKKALYTQQDTLNINGFKFTKKEFNEIVDDFPNFYADEVMHPDSLYRAEYRNPNFSKSYDIGISFDCSAGQDRFFALYSYFLTKKNKGTRFEYLGPHLTNSYQTVNTIFERLNLGGTHYIHQSGCIPAWVAYDVHFINKSDRKPEFTKKTRSDRWLFIDDLKQQIKEESTMADIAYEEIDNLKTEDLINKLNEEIINDYILYKVQKFTKPYMDDFIATKKDSDGQQ